MRYREYAAPPRLASVVHCVWTLEGHARDRGDSQPVCPDGRPEIIMHLADSFERIDSAGGCARQPRLIFAGQLLEPIALRATGPVAVVGVRLQPHGAAALLDDPQQALVGLTIDIDALSPRLARALDEVRQRTHTLEESAQEMVRCLAARVDPRRVDRHVSAAVDRIQRTRGLVTIDALARHVNLTPRHLERRFNTVVGISPKRLARIRRFQRALHVLGTLESPQRGAETAAVCGYADQAHFIRDFREMAGCPPGAHLLRQAELTGFFAAGR
jgi:AraC-like DNA-binding protein